MFRMVFSIIGVVFRIKVLGIDAGAGERDVFMDKKGVSVLFHAENLKKTAEAPILLRGVGGITSTRSGWGDRRKYP